MGSIEILPTPSGLLLWELYSQGIRLGVSSRGWASLRADPKTPELLFVDDDFELITFDFVTEPSTYQPESTNSSSREIVSSASRLMA